jgi:putative ABC transport system permease protein
MWQTQFGSRQEIVGQTLRLDGEPYTIIGVMPEGFEFPDVETEFWTPLPLRPSEPGRIEVLPVIARLKEGVTVEQARSEADALIERLRQETSEDDPRHSGVQVHLGSLHEQTVGTVRPALMVLLAAVGFVLLIACANVANLLMSRAAGRGKEIAVRAAIGAGRLRLIRQMLTESLVLALIGGALGLVVAYWGIRVLRRLSPDDIPRLDEVAINPTVLLFTLGVAVVTAIIFGLAPALRTSRVDLTQSLKEGTGASPAGLRLFRRHRGRSVFAVLEIALAFVLLIGAGLMIRSFVILMQQDTGYDPRGVVTVRLNLPRSTYGQEQAWKSFYDQLLERVRSLSGAQNAGVVNVLPMVGARYVMGLQIEGRPPATRPEEMARADFRLVSPGYFQAMGIRLLQGRMITEQDGPDSPRVVVINQSLADEYFPDEDPIGKRVQVGEITGVVANVRQFGLDEEPTPEIYLSYRQAGGPLAQTLSGMSLVVRSGGGVDPLSLVPAIRSQVTAIDPDMPIDEILTMEQRVSNSVAGPRFYAALLGLFSALALILAASGIYGVISYSVSQRNAETGIRMALGARTEDISRMVLGEGLVLTLVGVGLGLAASFAATRVLSSLLFGVGTTDPTTFVGVALLLTLVTLMACYVPARRAARVDPSIALRYE